MVRSINPTNIDWDKLIEKYPNRYLLVRDDNTGELLEVHDKKTGDIWFRIDERWMVMGG